MHINQQQISTAMPQNCRVKRTYKKCVGGKLCNPQDEFDMLESCKDCKKYL